MRPQKKLFYTEIKFVTDEVIKYKETVYQKMLCFSWNRIAHGCRHEINLELWYRFFCFFGAIHIENPVSLTIMFAKNKRKLLLFITNSGHVKMYSACNRQLSFCWCHPHTQGFIYICIRKNVNIHNIVCNIPKVYQFGDYLLAFSFRSSNLFIQNSIFKKFSSFILDLCKDYRLTSIDVSTKFVIKHGI